MMYKSPKLFLRSGLAMAVLACGTAAGNVWAQQNYFTGLDPHIFVQNMPPPKGHPSYVRAQQMLDCQDLLDEISDLESTGQARSVQDLELPEVQQRIFFLEVRKILCQDVPPEDRPLIQKLMTEAALAGDPGARTFKAVEKLVHEESAKKWNDPASENAKLAAKELLGLAMTGDPVAMSYAYEITVTDRYHLYDPVESAAWKLVLSPDPSAEILDPYIAGELLPSNVPAGNVDRDKVVARAQVIFNACCAMRP
ncbi:MULTISPECIES: hypothetical protein [unclassified Acidovorax]|uniref:hypothetical protein n=1 Tax=unclassified Acidovorax TaxID=2684926 RepID=UPI0012E15DD9|nr:MULTISPECIES: hypothetical protein [unclassified Acidovorax]